MLNILFSIVLLISTVVGFFFTFKLNKVEQVFSNLDSKLVSNCIEFNPLTEKFYFEKEELYELITTYFKKNLEDFEYKLKFAFREDNLSTTFSDTPNIVQIDINARILFEDIYTNNVRFTINGREVSKDWRSTF